MAATTTICDKTLRSIVSQESSSLNFMRLLLIDMSKQMEMPLVLSALSRLVIVYCFLTL